MEFAQQLDPAEHGWTAPVAHTVAGISYRQLDYWTRVGFVLPSIAQADGTGTRRLWSTADVVVLAVLARLRSVGVDLSVAARYADQARDETLASIAVWVADETLLTMDLTAVRLAVGRRLMEVLDGPVLARSNNETRPHRQPELARPVRI